jgi:Helix-turn-helix domain
MEPVDNERVEDVPRSARPWSLMQAAAFCGVSERTLKRWIEQGYPATSKHPFPKPPPHFIIGGRYKFDPGELRAWREAQRGAA